MKKLIYLFSVGIFLTGFSLQAVEHFVDAKNPYNGQVHHYFICDNNKTVRIVKRGENRYQFYSTGGTDIMTGKSPLDVASHVCRHYLNSH